MGLLSEAAPGAHTCLNRRPRRPHRRLGASRPNVLAETGRSLIGRTLKLIITPHARYVTDAATLLFTQLPAGNEFRTISPISSTVYPGLGLHVSDGLCLSALGRRERGLGSTCQADETPAPPSPAVLIGLSLVWSRRRNFGSSLPTRVVACLLILLASG